MKMKYRDRVHPELLEIYDASPDLVVDDNFASSLRKYIEDDFEANGLPTSEDVEVSEQYITGKNGIKDIGVRIYKPVNNNEIQPCLLWIHGGGYIAGFPKMNEGLCIRFVTEAKCVVVSVDYHLAPEYQYPTQIEDCYSALQWIYDNAGELNIDRECIAVAGASAGGGLTAALSLLARDRGGPKLIFQMPIYPMIDNRCDAPSSLEMQDRIAWNGDGNKFAWSLYLGDMVNADDVPPYAAAARAADYKGLPATFTWIGELHPLRDETIEYVARLSHAGVPVEFHLYPGCYHSSEASAVRTRIGDLVTDGVIDALARAFHPFKP